jgi:hypothetical protein
VLIAGGREGAGCRLVQTPSQARFHGSRCRVAKLDSNSSLAATKNGDGLFRDYFQLWGSRRCGPLDEQSAAPEQHTPSNKSCSRHLVVIDSGKHF